MTYFVCISGKARHGKDTSANFLKESLENKGYSAIVVHYADLLKFICKSYFGWDGKKDEKGRSLLQAIGTDHIRKMDQDYWVRFVTDLVSMFPKQWDFVIVADTRFENEIGMVRASGFPATHVRVVRKEFDNNLTEEQKNHKSEVALNECIPDRWLYNTSMDELEEEVEKLAEYVIWQSEAYHYRGEV